MKDTDYITMIHQIETGTELWVGRPDWLLEKFISNNYWRGKKPNIEGNLRERGNILNIAHKTHLGHESMITQLRGRVFWVLMTADVHQLATEYDPCQRNHISNSKEGVEVSHKSMFNLWPGKEVHMDFFKYNGNNFVFIVNRLIGYIHCEKSAN